MKYSKEKFEAVWKEAKAQEVRCFKRDFLDDYLADGQDLEEVIINGVTYK